SVRTELTPGDDRGAGDEHLLDAVGGTIHAGRTSGQIVPHDDRTGTDGVWIEDHQVRPVARGDAATIPQAGESRWHLGEIVDGLFQRQEAVLAYRLGDHGCGVGERIDHVEVGAGIGRPDDDARITPQLGPQSPGLFVLTLLLV